ncbi:MAG TPA: hypothetical protein VK937_04760, partial [Candidatus Limnocylindria bacterium]|nr:hypothetical protein [Candidatus Limnocylindria bacterium]
THTCHTRIAQDSPELGSRVFGETGEARIRVTYRRAQLNRLKSGLGKLAIVPKSRATLPQSDY